MKILSIAKTSSLKYDERIIKESESLLKVGVKHLDIYAIEKKTSQLNIENVNLYSQKLSSLAKKFGLFKILDIIWLYFIIETKVKKNDYSYIWIHDPIMIFIIPFLMIGFKKAIIWDLHELPPDIFFKSKLLKKIFLKIAALCEEIIVANNERGKYMVQKNLISNFHVLCNYPNKSVASDLENYNDVEFRKWIQGKQFAYCQSATSPSRNFYSLAKACIDQQQPLVVVGEKNQTYQAVSKKLNKFDEFVKVLGKKPSFCLPYYLSKARFSFVVYSNKDMNNYFCAPNRLYHSISYGIPVIVGMNPTMSDIVGKNNCGVILEGFGKEIEGICNAIKEMNKKYIFYKKNVKSISSKYIWENQEPVLKKLISKN